MSLELNEFIKEAKTNIIAKNHTFINVIHGYYIFDLIPDLVERANAKKVLLINFGEENENIVKDYIENNTLPFELIVKDMWGDFIRVNENKVSINDSMFMSENEEYIGVDLIIVHSVNGLPNDILRELIQKVRMIPIFLIGDSKQFCEDVDIQRGLEKSRFYISETSKVPGYNLEVVYFNKRIRSGHIGKLEPTMHRSYEIILRDLNAIPVEELLNYEVIISTLRDPRELNNEIRLLFGYPPEPRPGEKMVNINGCFVDDLETGETIYVDTYAFIDVLEINKSCGVLYGIFKYKGKTFRANIDVEYINMITGSNVEDVIPNTNGLKLDYTYVIPPKYAAFKMFDKVLILFSSIDGSSTGRVSLYQITSSVKKKLVMFTDAYYFMY